MYKPLVSIIIPTYNRAELLMETLKSVHIQTYKTGKVLCLCLQKVGLK